MFLDPSQKISVHGMNHAVAELAVREAFAVGHAGSVLQKIIEIPGISEGAVVSTCNRVELITVGVNGNCIPDIELVFSEISKLPVRAFSKTLYHLHGKAAVSHVFRVASGLDSLVVGEPQILGQLKEAYRMAQEGGAAKRLLNRLLPASFHVAKAVRSRTKIGHHAVSVCFAARELAREIFGDLSQATLMVIGAGEVGTLALKHFYSAGVRKIFLLNKTLANAQDLASTCGGVAADLADLPLYLPRADIVLGASALPVGVPPLVSEKDVTVSFRARPGKPQFFIDLGVPRNFSSAIADLSDAFLYNIDDLEAVVQKNLGGRILEVRRAEFIVEEEVDKFMNWLEREPQQRDIRLLVERCEQHREHEVRKTLHRIRQANLSDQQLNVVQAALGDLCGGLLAKTLHQPLSFYKSLGAEDSQAREWFQRCFLDHSSILPDESNDESSSSSSCAVEELMVSGGASKS